MKKILFVCSHLHSGSSMLCQILNNHPRIQSFNYLSKNYAHPENLIILSNQHHKLANRAAIYLDELLYNYQFSIKSAYKECKFIYLVREPEFVINSLITQQKMKISNAINYYSYRLRRICEMSRETPGAVLLTKNDLDAGKGKELIEEYLNLKTPLQDFLSQNFNDQEKITDLVGHTRLSKVEETFQRYLYYLKNQNLRRI